MCRLRCDGLRYSPVNKEESLVVRTSSNGRSSATAPSYSYRRIRHHLRDLCGPEIYLRDIIHHIQLLPIPKLDLIHALIDIETKINIGGVSKAMLHLFRDLLAIRGDICKGDGNVDARYNTLPEAWSVYPRGLQLSCTDADDTGNLSIREYLGCLVEDNVGGVIVADATIGVATANTQSVVDFDWLEEGRCRRGGASSLPYFAVDESSATRFVCSEESRSRGV